jgi:hypothetical protein
MSAGVYVLDPLADPRWDDLLERHPRASVFHSRGWLEALRRTYAYEPFVVTTTERGPLANGLVLCRVRTWMSRRLVSLPFSDHCDPLVDQPDDLSAMLEFLRGEVEGGGYRSFELRPLSGVGRPFAGLSEVEGRGAEAVGRPFPGLSNVEGKIAEGASFCLHTLDLARPAEQIFDGFHHSCTQRAIRRAEREGLSYEAGTSDRLVSSFYELLRQTRRRHGLPPPPVSWFRNLAACVGDGLAVHLASKDGLPIAGILTLSFKKTMVYKYGGSDAARHPLGGMPFLFWCAIQEAQAQGIEELDLGRSELDQPGLVAFKDHLGATRTTLTYYTCPARRPGKAHAGPLSRAARRIVPYLPDAALDLTGRLLYKHLG